MITETRMKVYIACIYMVAFFCLGWLIGNITSDRIGDPKFDPKLKECLERSK